MVKVGESLRPASALKGFSGTARVSQTFAQLGTDVNCSDVSVWSNVLGTCYLKTLAPIDCMDLIHHLNSRPP